MSCDENDLSFEISMWAFVISILILVVFGLSSFEGIIISWKFFLVSWLVCCLVIYGFFEYKLVKNIKQCKGVCNHGLCLGKEDDGRTFGSFLFGNLLIFIFSFVTSGGTSVIIYILRNMYNDTLAFFRSRPDLFMIYARNIMLFVLIVGAFLVVKLLLYKYAIGGKKK